MSQAVDSSALKPLPFWQDLQQAADGTLFSEPAGMHFVHAERATGSINYRPLTPCVQKSLQKHLVPVVRASLTVYVMPLPVEHYE